MVEARLLLLSYIGGQGVLHGSGCRRRHGPPPPPLPPLVQQVGHERAVQLVDGTEQWSTALFRLPLLIQSPIDNKQRCGRTLHHLVDFG